MHIATGPCESHVGNSWRTNVLDAAVLTTVRAEIFEESFATTEQDRDNYQVHVID